MQLFQKVLLFKHVVKQSAKIWFSCKKASVLGWNRYKRYNNFVLAANTLRYEAELFALWVGSRSFPLESVESSMWEW